MDEVVVVNERYEIIGSMPKVEAHRNGTQHRIAVVYVLNKKSEFVVQHRADGYLDHSAAGHVDVDETYEEAAKRELFEELGIKDVNLKRIGHGTTKNERYPDSISSHTFDIFSCVAEPGALQTKEVKDIFWSKPDSILKDMKESPEKYCEGFKVSLPILVSSLSLSKD